MCQLSIIIPTLNEEACLRQTLQHLLTLRPAPAEIIVVDGGSTDQTAGIAADFDVRFVNSKKKGRAAQMNQGAALARGDHLCFLHADTYVPTDLVSIIRKTMADPKVTLAGFISVMGYQGKTQWFATCLNYGKTYLGPLLYSPYQCLFKGMRLLFGDQVMFCRTRNFRQIGGFDPELSIMEEADLCKRMNRIGSIRQINRKVYTSDRRVVSLGFWKAYTIYISIFFLWTLGVSPHRLKKFYEEIR
jgi:rSAM/selenodomain-associated transferase 2